MKEKGKDFLAKTEIAGDKVKALVEKGLEKKGKYQIPLIVAILAVAVAGALSSAKALIAGVIVFVAFLAPSFLRKGLGEKKEDKEEVKACSIEKKEDPKEENKKDEKVVKKKVAKKKETKKVAKKDK